MTLIHILSPIVVQDDYQSFEYIGANNYSNKFQNLFIHLLKHPKALYVSL